MSFWNDALGPRQRFDGGLFLPDYKSVTAKRPIEKMDVNGPLHVPLQLRLDLSSRVLVRAGERVLGGQPLAEPAGPDSVTISAPTSGRIVALDRVWTAADGHLPGAVLEPDGNDEWLPPDRDWMADSFMEQLVNCGAVCSAPREPLHVLIRQAIAADATDVIVNAVETEPYLTADLRSLVEMPGRMVDATCEIASALGARHVQLAVAFRHRRVVKRLEAEARGRFVEVAPLPHPYPQCHPVVLVKSLLGREVPPGGTTLDVGVLVLPLAAVRGAASALLDGRPVTRTIMTVAGDVVDRPGAYNVPVGTPMRRVAEFAGLAAPVAAAVWGGPLTGVSLGRDEAVVTVDTTALLLFSGAKRAEPIPCIHCGWCTEDCPVGANPAELMQLESEESCNADALAQLQACVDCGLCSYVCPAQLPLAASIRSSRERFTRAFRAEAATTT
jgi:electron transport complex protein RnfC